MTHKYGGPERRHSGEGCDIHKLAKDVARETVRDTFMVLGIDINNHDEVRSFQANQMWTYNTRKLSGKVKAFFVIVIIGGILTTLGLNK
jgi:hypothetical protein